MMLQKRVDYRFIGYHMPPVPRAARSARRRGTLKRKDDETQMCRFDLLANIAGKLLSESDSMDTSSKKQYETAYDSVKKENHDEDKHLESSGLYCGIDRNFIVSDLVLRAPCINGFPKELPCTQRDACSGPGSVIKASEQLVSSELKAGNMDIELFGCKLTPGCKLESEGNKVAEAEKNYTEMAVNKSEIVCNSEFQMTLDSKPFGLGCSDNSHKFSSSKEDVPNGPLSFNQEDHNLVIRDDDEKLSWCTQSSTKNKAFRPSHRIGDRRIRKILASKYWNVAPNKNDEEHLSSDSEKKHTSQNGKNGSKLIRSQKDYPFKKRKLYDWSSVSNSDGEFCSDGTCKSPPQKDIDGYASASMLPRASGTSAKSKSKSTAREHSSFQTKNSHVKLKIRSFRVPELLIEISENATVGSLKKTVMEAVTTILSSGLHVGVLLQGKKIRDDNKTLLQSGISHNNKLDSLGFTLEPNSTQTLRPSSLEDCPRLLPFDAPEPLSRYPPMPVTSLNAELGGTSDTLPDPRGSNVSNNSIESDHDSAPSPDMSYEEKTAVDSRALVAIPTMSVEALSVVPMRKSKRSSEAAQRRIRRPFSVSEVEALVQAVEKLGTGRWRDVKLRAFENAKHRTYVDLKDKWKTLVHTAKISPQQRRGEPVPQELLDRVLDAHAYWSQQQVKQQFKQQFKHELGPNVFSDNL